MLITLVKIKNFQCLKDVEITLRPGDRNWIFIGGKNEQGKSSLMRGIRSALGGGTYKPDMPVRKGEKSALIHLELDDGATVITKTFTEDGKAKLKVISEEYGKLSSPQVTLDKIVGHRFLDPLEFMNLNAKAQREKLLSIVDIAIDLDEHAKKRKGIFSARTDSNRDVKRLRAELGAFDVVDEIPERMDIKALIGKHQELLEQASEAGNAARAIEHLKTKTKSAREEVESMEAAIIEARKVLKEAEGFADAELERLGAIAAVDVTEEVAKVAEEISSCDTHNEHVGKLEATKAASDSVSSKLFRAESEASGFDAKLKALDKAKAKALAAAQMPVEGLDISDDAVLFDGVPLSQASSARKIRISLALASAAKPQLGDIQIENVSLLDEESLSEVIKYAVEHDLRVWLEVVGESHDDCIIIEEGAVKGAAPE